MSIPNAPDLQSINYHLDNDRIAKHPLSNRDDSKLLYFKGGNIRDEVFSSITNVLEPGTSLFFNNTKVIPARLFFQKDTGAQIEIFLLKPILPSTVISVVMEERKRVTWECMVGNLKKWREGQLLSRVLETGRDSIKVEASILDRTSKQITFSWDNPNFSFAEVVEMAGSVPLPPYLNRKPEPEDKPRYQTVYSAYEGAVAAPTAGLHFTDEILEKLKQKGIKESFLTLHVSAGTFQPIKVDDARDHPMHSEQIEVDRKTIEDVIRSEKIVAVGTTSMRSLESLYWYGVRLIEGNTEFAIEKLEIYQNRDQLPGRKAAFQAILDYMSLNNMEKLGGSTEIFIMPGYHFKVCDGLITNFHQPGSTLLLLIAAFVGDAWKEIYNHALANDYRFLSYGDSSLLLP